MKSHRSRALIPIGIIIVLIAVIIIITYRRASPPDIPTPQVPATSTPSSILQSLTVSGQTIKQQDPAGEYTVTAVYPVIAGTGHADSDIKVNHAILDEVNSVIHDFIQSESDVTIVPGAGPSTLDITYAVEPNTTAPNILSLRLIESSFESGAAHPAQTIDTMTFNTATGAQISLGDLFSTPDYLNTLSSSAIEKLDTRLGTDTDTESQINIGAAPTDDNYGAFVLTDTGIDIIFQEYQVSSYAAGIQEVLIPYSEIKDIIDQNGPLAYLFRQ